MGQPCIHLRLRFLALAGAAIAFLPGIASAQDKPAEPAKPITERDVGAKDVALTPLSDLNLRKGEIPPLLIDAQERPYDLTGLNRCPALAAAVGELDAVLGDDLDVAQAKAQTLSPGRVVQSVARSFIPFNGVIREISGANNQERKIQTAIYAGTARRSFLKGVGQQRGCRYPARSATAQVIAAAEAEAEAQRIAESQRKSRKRRN
jgi:hypothetical protein